MLATGMNNPIAKENFLLESDLAERLFHEHASPCPIIDYHCHLSPKELAKNKVYENITKIWLDGDHYKWRAMRANGISEKYITGEAADDEKFEKWAETVPYTLRNPLYHWTHLELYQVFGINEILNGQTAKAIYERTSGALTDSLDTHTILKKFNVTYIGTTDDPTDTLEWHQMIAESDWGVTVKPTWRPDRALAVGNPKVFNDYSTKLGELTNRPITVFEDFLAALHERHGYFHDNGCRLADHGLEYPFPIAGCTSQEANAIFRKLQQEIRLTPFEIEQFRAILLHEFAVWNHEKGWAQQFHVGALRDVNTTGVRNVGQACGFDSIADFNYASTMGHFFDKLEKLGKLAKTIVYNLNPRDNDMVASMLGNFQDGSVPSKMQFGAAWWFLDQKDGITKHINTISNHGLLSRFIGMLTDSRSLLSYSRHDYFRRILCNLLADDINKGEMPNDEGWVGKIIRDICFGNAQNYFNITT